MTKATGSQMNWVTAPRGGPMATAGHVGLYVGEDAAAYHVLGGNQSDKVCITRIAKNRLYAIRRPQFKIGQPRNVRQVFLESSGRLSTNEA